LENARRGGRPFVKGDPRINRKGTSSPGVAGRPSELHRSECRRLVEKHKIREFFADITDGKKVDYYFTLGGKMRKVPANVGNRIKAGLALMEQGHGRKLEVEHNISPKTIEEFGQRLVDIFQRRLPKRCPACRTDLALPPELAAEILQLSRMFEAPGADPVRDAA
jgi:hypothetical protein